MCLRGTLCEYKLYQTAERLSQMSEDVVKGISQTALLHSCVQQRVSPCASGSALRGWPCSFITRCMEVHPCVQTQIFGGLFSHLQTRPESFA